jgi:aspartyl protease family protein
MLRSLAILACATVAALVAGVGTVGAVHVAGVLAPEAARRVRVAKSPDGHFWTAVTINGRSVRMLVDTGSSAVALTLADAARLGLDVDQLAFTRTVATAGGVAKAAPVTLEQVSVDGAQVSQVRALVVRAGLDSSLLGMSYLGRLNGFAADRNGLTLTP